MTFLGVKRGGLKFIVNLLDSVFWHCVDCSYVKCPKKACKCGMVMVNSFL